MTCVTIHRSGVIDVASKADAAGVSLGDGPVGSEGSPPCAFRQEAIRPEEQKAARLRSTAAWRWNSADLPQDEGQAFRLSFAATADTPDSQAFLA